MPFEMTVRAFAAALDDPSAAAPAMTHGRMGAPDARRFAVYRNNVAVGLIGALEARYPVSRRIAGDDLFRAMARAFMRAHKPRSPVMIAYGEEFPEFVAEYLAETGPTVRDTMLRLRRERLGASPPPLWGRNKEGGRTVLRDKRAAEHSIISSVRATPHPCPPPQEGAGALTASILPNASTCSLPLDVARLENAWVEAYHAEDASVATVGELAALSPDCLPGTRIAFHPATRLMRFATPAASVWASAQSSTGPAAPAEEIGEDALITRPDCDVRVRVLPPLGYDFALRLREGATLLEAAHGSRRPSLRLRRPSGRADRLRRRRLHHSRTIVMIADAAHATALEPSNPIARLTSLVFGLVPSWLPLLILRLALARPFFASGLTRWDGWFTLSFGTKILFSQEYKLHIFGAEIPFPMPELVATMASTAEIVLPILLAFGLLTRWAALGLLCMTANHPAHLSGRLGELPSVLGDDGARDPHLRPWRDLARPAARPRRLERKAQG